MMMMMWPHLGTNQELMRTVTRTRTGLRSLQALRPHVLMQAPVVHNANRWGVVHTQLQRTQAPTPMPMGQ